LFLFTTADLRRCSLGKPLAKQLKEHGVRIGADDFRNLLAAVMCSPMFRKYRNDEALMHEPTDALLFCKVIRTRVRAVRLPDPVILRALSGWRKRAA
jgi:hypothetical protein